MIEDNQGVAQTPPPRPPKNHRLTNRDIQLLQLLSEYGCVDAERIKVKLWNANPNSRAHFRRLGILKKMKLVENVLGDQGFGLGYRISKQGLKLLTDNGQTVDHARTRRGYGTQFEHDQLLIQIRTILEKSPVVREFMTEAKVRDELLGVQKGPVDWKTAPTIPDGTFVYEVPGQRLRIALELEMTQKSQARYFKILRNHMLNRKWEMAFYIVRDDSFMRRLLELADEVRREDATVRVAKRINDLYFCSLEKFLANELKVQFTNGEKEISLDDLAQKAQGKRPSNYG